MFCKLFKNKTIAIFLGILTLVGINYASLALGQTVTPTKSPEAKPANVKVVDPKRQLVDSILASVSDEIVLLSDLQKAVLLSSNNQSKVLSSGKIEGGSITEKDVTMLFDQLIDQKIIGLRIKEQGLSISNEELDSEINHFLKQNNQTIADLTKMLKEEGESMDNYREEFRRQAETQRYIGKVIRPIVAVNEDEVRNYYVQQTAGSTEKIKKILLRSLTIEIPESLSDEQKKTKKQILEEIKSKIESRADFLDLVKVYSDDKTSREKGGELPPRAITELPAELKAKVQTAQIKDIIGPIQLGSSFFFFQYLGNTLSDMSEFDKQKNEWEMKLLDLKMRERFADHIKAERAKARIIKMPFKFYR